MDATGESRWKLWAIDNRQMCRHVLMWVWVMSIASASQFFFLRLSNRYPSSFSVRHTRRQRNNICSDSFCRVDSLCGSRRGICMNGGWTQAILSTSSSQIGIGWRATLLIRQARTVWIVSLGTINYASSQVCRNHSSKIRLSRHRTNLQIFLCGLGNIRENIKFVVFIVVPKDLWDDGENWSYLFTFVWYYLLATNCRDALG